MLSSNPPTTLFQFQSKEAGDSKEGYNITTHYKIFDMTLSCYFYNYYCLKIIRLLIFDYLRNLRKVENLYDCYATVILVIMYQSIRVILSTKLIFRVEEDSCLCAWARKSLSRLIEQGSLLSEDFSGSLYLEWLSIEVYCKYAWEICNLFLIIVKSSCWGNGIGLLSVEERNLDNLCVLLAFTSKVYISAVVFNSDIRVWTLFRIWTYRFRRKMIFKYTQFNPPSCVLFSPT